MDDKLFHPYIYYAICAVLSAGILFGIFLMSKVEKSKLGNRINAVCVLCGIITILLYNNIISYWILYVGLLIGSALGLIMSRKVKMIQMPQMVALLNGLGGAASAIVGCFALSGIGAETDPFSLATSALAIAIGMITLAGSLVAAGKLHRILPQKPITLKFHQIYTAITLLIIVALVVLSAINVLPSNLLWVLIVLNLLISGAFGVLFSIRVGGADMPITISLLNSLSGVAGAIAGLAISDLLLVAVGGIVGASGLVLTQIMCRAINRSLMDILLSKSSKSKHHGSAAESAPKDDNASEQIDTESDSAAEEDPYEVLRNAKRVIVVPGYGMAIAQAQHTVKELSDKLKGNGADVKYAIHPVAGRMPGHMNVLLCEADVEYEDLYEMDDIDGEFAQADAAIVIGANDVLNPAARDAVDTPIYGMPVLSVDKCKHIYIFNYDKKPGYAGVDNPLYSQKHGVYLFLGNAAETLKEFISKL